MSSASESVKRSVSYLRNTKNFDETVRLINSKQSAHLEPIRFPLEGRSTTEGTKNRLEFLQSIGKKMPHLSANPQQTDIEFLQGNIENYIGMSQVPTGIIGPLQIVGTQARGDFYVPLATTEGALVASYDRGARATRLAGGITSICLIECVQRSPVFKFANIAELGQFLAWVLPQIEKFREITGQISRFAKLLEMKSNVEGNQLILTFEYHTGDAAGQNMVTLCTDAICKYIVENATIKPAFWFVEGNFSGDKKATSLSFTNVRGKKVTAEVHLTKDIVEQALRTSPQAMVNYWQSSTIGVIQSGAIGAQGHVANGLCALFIATGQDAACVAEAAVGITRMELLSDGGLYASVTLPNLIIGSIGGGTRLSTQRECLELMDCYGEGKSRKFAEICGALSLAGELSIAAALSAGHFSAAHKKFGRQK